MIVYFDFDNNSSKENCIQANKALYITLDAKLLILINNGSDEIAELLKQFRMD